MSAARQGLYTLFEAECEKYPELMRLYLCGERGTRPLGIMEPCRRGMYLSKKLSSSSLRESPGRLERALILPLDEKAEEKLKKPLKEERKAAVPENSWIQLPDGCLRGIYMGQRCIALPSALSLRPEGLRILEICGREYLLFRY